MRERLRYELHRRTRRGMPLRERLEVTPEQYVYIAWTAMILLAVIVLTGAAVRLTDSGLGCPTWPRCYGKVYPPDQTHALIEFSNRVASTLVGLGVAFVAIFSLTRRPFRRDLAILAWLLPLGVVAQAVLGGFTVRYHLAPGFVMAHFSLSMVILIAAVALVWRASYDGSRPRRNGRLVVWMTRVTVALGGLTIFAGTVATGAGPHGGGFTGQDIHRLTFKGPKTLEWAVNQHATGRRPVRGPADRDVGGQDPQARLDRRVRPVDDPRRRARRTRVARRGPVRAQAARRDGLAPRRAGDDALAAGAVGMGRIGRPARRADLIEGSSRPPRVSAETCARGRVWMSRGPDRTAV